MNPKAKIIPFEITTHGHTRIDNYYWLREKDNPEVNDYINAQNEYCETQMAHTKELQEELYQEILARVKETVTSVEIKNGKYSYYRKFVKGLQHRSFWRKEIGSEKEELLLDLNEIAKNYDSLRLGVFKLSPNHQLLAYSIDTSGDESFELFVKDLQTNKLLEDHLNKTSKSLEWTDDGSFFYCCNNNSARSSKVYKHRLGTKQIDDEEIFHEKDKSFWLEIEKSKDNNYLLIKSSNLDTSELHSLDLRRVELGFKLIQKRIEGLDYRLEPHQDKYYILNNDKTDNYKVSLVSTQNPSKENWQDYIKARNDVKIDDIEVFAKYMVIYGRKAGQKIIEIVRLSDKRILEVSFPEPVYTYWRMPNPEYSADKLLIDYTSLTTPHSVYEINMENGKWQLIKAQEILGGFDKNQYFSERIFATSDDRTKVPISLVYKNDLFKKDGNNPTLLLGHGAYGFVREPSFSPLSLSLINRGFVIAYAHVRGSGIYGNSWHEDGRLLKKKNSFLDFIACAKELIKEKYTRPNKLAIEGRSAGGLLMAASLNMAPYLFKAAIISAAFVDVVTRSLDRSLPMTTGNLKEFGDPRDKDFYDYLLSYSPYDNIEAKDYPNILIKAGMNDPRIQYWEAAKYAAKLAELKTDSNKLLLKTNMGAGHGRASGRYDLLREKVYGYTFLLETVTEQLSR